MLTARVTFTFPVEVIDVVTVSILRPLRCAALTFPEVAHLLMVSAAGLLAVSVAASAAYRAPTPSRSGRTLAPSREPTQAPFDKDVRVVAVPVPAVEPTRYAVRAIGESA